MVNSTSARDSPGSFEVGARSALSATPRYSGRMYVPLPRFLLRAPLLPARRSERGPRALLRQPLGADAVRLASPSLARAAAGARRDRALDRYARRAAFRPTPHGLLAGVCMGRLAARTAVATGTPAAHLAPTWARIEALARALLDNPDFRARTRLRVAPSALLGASVVRWLGPGTMAADDVRARSDAQTSDVRRGARGGARRAAAGHPRGRASSWAPWSDVRAAARRRRRDGDADELLLTLLDDGLLQSDSAPPIVGAAAGSTCARGWTRSARRTRRARSPGDRGAPRPVSSRAARRVSPRSRAAATTAGIHAVLVHRPRKPPTLERAAVERAARLVPLLVRLQDALAPPAAERFAQPALADALDAVTELYGGGRVRRRRAGDRRLRRGAARRRRRRRSPRRPPDASGADPAARRDRGRRAASGRDEAALDADALEEALRDVAGPRLPCSAELFLAPVPRRPAQAARYRLAAGPARARRRFAGPLRSRAGRRGARRRWPVSRRPNGARARRRSPSTSRFAPAPALTDLAARPRTRAGPSRCRAGANRRRRRPSGAASWRPPRSNWSPIPTRRTRSRCANGATGGPIVPASFARLRSPTAPAGSPASWSAGACGASTPPGRCRSVRSPSWPSSPASASTGSSSRPPAGALPPGVRTPGGIRRWRQAAAGPTLRAGRRR